MISDNHNIYSNYIDEYELTDGYAVVDSNFSIVTANEPMYMFLGMSKHYSLIDSIHQVDLDDFPQANAKQFEHQMGLLIERIGEQAVIAVHEQHPREARSPVDRVHDEHKIRQICEHQLIDRPLRLRRERKRQNG